MKVEPKTKSVVVLGTGGTIAGTAHVATDNLGYTAATVPVADLLSTLPGLTDVLQGHHLNTEQVAQVDSKDMDFDIWLALARRVCHHLAQSDVAAVVITHGTDTLEETAYFLHAVLPLQLQNAKPVVLTCAMRPATALAPDGPQNLLDAVSVALTTAAHGVLAVCAGTVHGALEVQKVHTYRLDAFSSADAGPVGYVEEGRIRLVKNWPLAHIPYALDAINDCGLQLQWPRVEIVTSHAGSRGDVVDALLRHDAPCSPLRGIVVAASGNGTIHHRLEVALQRAQQSGVSVLRSTRCVFGQVLPSANALFAHAEGLPPAKARIALMLTLMQSGNAP